MTTIVPSLADRNRDANATNLVARHLAERGAKHVKAKQVGGRLVWTVESQTRPGVTYTVTRECDGWEADTCSCEDACYRHMECKHRRAVALISPPAPIAQAAPVPAVPGFAFTPRPRRTEWEEEI